MKRIRVSVMAEFIVPAHSEVRFLFKGVPPEKLPAIVDGVANTYDLRTGRMTDSKPIKLRMTMEEEEE